MEAKVLSCGYSYHIQPFHNSYGQGLPFYLFRLQSEGSAYVQVNGNRMKIEAGDLLLCKPGDTYELRVEAEDEGSGVASGDFFLFSRGEWIDAWWTRYARTACTRIDLHDGLLSLWKLLVMERRRVAEKNVELSGYLLQALCIQIDRAITETSFVSGDAYAVSRMKRFIEAHATQSFKVQEVAAHVQLSESRAAHLFKELEGESVMQYALKVRLGMAVDRMKYTPLTLEQIAESCGLGSYPYFHRVFKEQFGSSPREYRRLLTGRG